MGEDQLTASTGRTDQRHGGGETLDMLEEMLPPLIRTMFEWIMQLFDQKEPHDMSNNSRCRSNMSNDFPYDEAQITCRKGHNSAAFEF